MEVVRANSPGFNELWQKLFVVENLMKGEVFTEKNVRSIRPGFGLPPKHAVDIYGKKARTDVKRGMPLEWGMIE